MPVGLVPARDAADEQGDEIHRLGLVFGRGEPEIPQAARPQPLAVGPLARVEGLAQIAPRLTRAEPAGDVGGPAAMPEKPPHLGAPALVGGHEEKVRILSFVEEHAVPLALGPPRSYYVDF